jgi:hypothetical protein
VRFNPVVESGVPGFIPRGGSAIWADVPALEQVAEHARDHILASMKEAAHDREQRPAGGDLDRVAGERTHEWRCGGAVEGAAERGTVGKRRAESLEACRVGPDLPHRVKVQLEMTRRLAGGADIGFLAEYDLVDQLRASAIPRWQPGHLDTGEIALQPLHQRHEIPDRENVRLHEAPQRLHVLDRAKEGVLDHSLTQRAEIDDGNGDDLGLRMWRSPVRSAITTKLFRARLKNAPQSAQQNGQNQLMSVRDLAHALFPR